MPRRFYRLLLVTKFPRVRSVLCRGDPEIVAVTPTPSGNFDFGKHSERASDNRAG